MNSNFFAPNLNTDYLPESDRYIFAKPVPEFRFNVIGAGMIGFEHIRVTMLEGRATIHGVYDTRRENMLRMKSMFESTYPGETLQTYDSLKDAIHDPAVDGLIICTPNYTHIEVVREAAKSTKHILLEKPMATTLADAIEIANLADSHEGVFQIGLQYRFKAIYAEAIHEALERKAIGDVKLIQMVEHRIPFLDKVNQWNKFSKYSGGTLVEKCCHYFDLMNLFAQSKPKAVVATGSQAVNFKDFEVDGTRSDILDNANVLVTYENGVQANFNLCMFSPMFYEELTLCGNAGRLRAYENVDYLPTNRPETHLEILTGENGTSKVSTPCYPKAIQQSGHHGGTYYEHKYFVDNIKGLKTSTATVEEGLWSILVGVAAEQAVKRQTVVYIDELLESTH